jgi:hypothetical protein
MLARELTHATLQEPRAPARVHTTLSLKLVMDSRPPRYYICMCVYYAVRSACQSRGQLVGQRQLMQFCCGGFGPLSYI